MNNIPMLFKKREDCCGCTACYAICPKDAITMIEDEEGFEYPQIDENKCVHCYQCMQESETCSVEMRGPRTFRAGSMIL